MIKKLILGFAFIVCLHQHLFAQNNNSPYSIAGLGDIEQSSFDRTSGMGHAGMALSSNRFFYNANPASYCALDDKFFNVEIAARYKGINYSGTPITDLSAQSSDLQFKKMVAAIKIKPKWGLALGLLPYSTANYSFSGYKSISGTSLTTPTYNQGTGSLNQLFMANSFKLSKHFSVGLQATYLFGQLSNIETIYANIADSNLITNAKTIVSTPLFKAGFQYNTRLSSSLQLFLGGTATIKTTIIAATNELVTYGNTTIENNTLYNSALNTLPPSIPTLYAGSIAARVKDKYTFAFDFSYQNWSSLNYSSYNYTLINSTHFGAGFEFLKKKKFGPYLVDRYFLQAGAFFNQSYIEVSGQPINAFGVTFGGGLNSIKNNLGLQINLELGERGTVSYDQIKEDYIQVNFIFSLRDLWYVNFKKYD